ncbi:MAG: thioredoxin [Oscillospiraceae bacterium]|nr:thioredoxin [Oscillospiraceae bacterium]
MSVSVDTDNFDKEVLKSEGIVLADFYSDSCGPCRKVSPVLNELEEKYKSKIKLAKIDVNCDAKLARKYVVRAVPTIVFFKNGTESTRIIGAADKSDYSSVIEKLI